MYGLCIVGSWTVESCIVKKHKQLGPTFPVSLQPVENHSPNLALQTSCQVYILAAKTPKAQKSTEK